MARDDMEQVLSTVEARLRQQNRRWLFTCIALVGVTIPGTMLAGSITVPNTFVPGTVAKSSEVNANFATLATEATRVSNIVQGPGDATNTNKVTNLAAPVAANDAANKAYADAAGSSGGSVTLIGTTTCPSGWDVALTGVPFFTSAAANVGAPTYACFGPGTKAPPITNFTIQLTTVIQGAAPTVLAAAGWMANADVQAGVVAYGTCVICVK